jgi:hypothetical protein
MDFLQQRQGPPRLLCAPKPHRHICNASGSLSPNQTDINIIMHAQPDQQVAATLSTLLLQCNAAKATQTTLPLVQNN